MALGGTHTLKLPDHAADLEAFAQWAGRLHDARRDVIDDLTEASGLAEQNSVIENFADDLGHRRLVDRPLLGKLLGIGAGEPPERMSSDVLLWWAIHDAAIEIDSKLLASGGEPRPLLVEEPTGPIEVWTEEELSSLHALWHLGVERNRPELMQQALGAARWHVQELQPDNATNHPWAVHVFVVLWRLDKSDAAHLHAQTLLNNCQVQTGQADRFSACILLDAAKCLETLIQNPDVEKSER